MCILTLPSLAKSLQFSLEIRVNYRLVGYLLADYSLICRLCMQCMIFKSNVKLCYVWQCVCRFFSSKQCIIKQCIRFGFCDIRNYQGLAKCYQPRLRPMLTTLTSTLIFTDITKTLSNNYYCLKSCSKNLIHCLFYTLPAAEVDDFGLLGLLNGLILISVELSLKLKFLCLSSLCLM